MTAPGRDTTSLVLTGGGSYSSYEVGVMTALFAGHSPSTGFTPFDPDVLIGTSAGAMNASVLAAQEVLTGSLTAAVAELQSIWINRIADSTSRCGNGVYRIRGLPYYLFDTDCVRGGLAPIISNTMEDASLFVRGSWNAARRFVGNVQAPVRTVAEFIDFSALISTAPFLESLEAILPLDVLDRSPRRLRIVALDLNAGQVKLFTEDDIRQLGYGPLLASTALPIFFPPHQIGDREYVNGTTLATTPLLPAIAESDTMHIIYMDPELQAISPIRLENIVDAMDRVMVVNFAYMLNQDIEFAQEINTALELMEDGFTPGSLGVMDVHALLRSMAPIRDRLLAGNPYKPLTIHRYHPRGDLGSNLGLMNLDSDRISSIIQLGYDDAVAHDCKVSGCVIPRQSSATRRRQPPPAPTGAAGSP